MKRIIHLMLLIYGFLPCSLLAQVLIRGTVKDATGPLPGVSIVEKGMSTNGTISN